MPNKPKTPTRTFRVPDGLWAKAQVKAFSESRTLTSVLVAALEAYVVDDESSAMSTARDSHCN